MLRLIGICFILFCLNNIAFAQFKLFQKTEANHLGEELKVKSPLSEGYSLELSEIVIQQLIDSAILNSPLLKNTKLERDVAVEELAGTKKNFLSMVSLLGGYNYGNVGNYTASETAQSASSVISNVVTSTYSFGVGVKVPLDQVVNRKHQVRMAQLTFNKLANDYDQAVRELRLLVINKYSDLQLQQKLLFLKEKNLKSAFVNLKMAEKMFEGGQVSISDLSTVTDLYTKSEIEIEMAKSDYRMVYYQLEQMVGVKLTGFFKE